LHILLENHFGELNENQEEMLGAARSAAEDADQAALRLRDIAQLDLGLLILRRDTVRLADLLATIIPSLSAAANQREVRLQTTIGPALPSFSGDRERLQEALALVLLDAVRRVPQGAIAQLSAEAVRGELHIVFAGVHGMSLPEDRALAHRIIRAHGGRIVDAGPAVSIVLPLHP
jgi:signal transduction histidine kinase